MMVDEAGIKILPLGDSFMKGTDGIMFDRKSNEGKKTAV